MQAEKKCDILPSMDKKLNTEKENVLVCMSYNFRYDGDKGTRRPKHRLPLIIERIKDLSPDIVGGQEAQSAHIAALRMALSPEYAIVYCYRQKPTLSRLHPECSPILFKKEKFEMLSSGNFWLSETPDVMSKMPGAQNFRICTWVRLKEKTTGKSFFYYNLHLDFGPAQNKSLPVLLSRLDKNSPVLLGGDFNLSPLSDNYKMITAELSDGRLITPAEADKTTYHEYGRFKDVLDEHIDFIFYRGDIRPIEYAVLDDDENRWGKGVFASDHYPVLTKFVL